MTSFPKQFKTRLMPFYVLYYASLIEQSSFFSYFTGIKIK